MRLSTSSSRGTRAFLCRLAAGFLALACLYGGLVHMVPKAPAGANQWQTNVAKAQDYCFAEAGYDYVLIGSSEAYNIPVERHHGWANLGFASGASPTGLALVAQRGEAGYPKAVVIEMNDTLLRGRDETLLDETGAWHRLPLMREWERPDYFVMSLLRLRKGGKAEKAAEDTAENPRRDALARAVAARSGRHLERAQLAAVLASMKEAVDSLRARGVRVIFFEPPNDAVLEHLPFTEETRAACREAFPPGEYQWLEFDWQAYRTTDGIHLDRGSAQRAAEKVVADAEGIS